MRSKHQVIYVPGLGDKHSRLQARIIGSWRRHGIEAHFFKMGWADDEPYSSKLARLNDKINELAKKGTVSLVGVSAGASAVLNTYAKRPKDIHRVITICGKILRPETVQQWRYRANPAFKGSMEMLSSSIASMGGAERDRVLTIKPLWDGVVNVDDAVLPGAPEKTVPTFGHAFSIVCTILFDARSIAKIVKAL